MANNQPPLALVENPLGLPLDEQGRAPSIAVENLPGIGRVSGQFLKWTIPEMDIF